MNSRPLSTGGGVEWGVAIVMDLSHANDFTHCPAFAIVTWTRQTWRLSSPYVEGDTIMSSNGQSWSVLFLSYLQFNLLTINISGWLANSEQCSSSMIQNSEDLSLSWEINGTSFLSGAWHFYRVCQECHLSCHRAYQPCLLTCKERA